MPCGDLADRLEHFLQPTAVKQPLVEMMRIAVVTEIQAKGVEAGSIQCQRRIEQVARFRAALPAVQQHCKRPVGHRGVRPVAQ